MRKRFTLALLSLLMVPLAMMAQTGTKGNTITFDSNNSTMLYSNLDVNKVTSKPAYSCYLRHNQAPIQILNANPTASSYTIAPLQSATGTGTGFFANSSLANNMGFSSNGKLQFFHLNQNQTPENDGNWAGSPYKYVCFAVIAPRGYRFTEYYMDIDGSKNNNGSSGATIMRYTYNNNSTYQFTPCSGETKNLTGASTGQIFTHTLSNAGNILYFRIEAASKTTQVCVTLNELRLKYVIDGDVDVTLPNSDGTKVHTGYINLGSLDYKTKNGNVHFFNKENVTDLEEVKIVAEDATSEISVVDGVVELSKGGTYWIESPAKFRITEAKLNFQMPSGSTETNYIETTTLESGGKYRIAGNSGNDGNTYYLTLNNNNAVSNNVNNPENSTVWTITASGNGYTIYSEAKGLYLAGTTTGANASLTTQQDPFVWTYNNRQFTYTYTAGWLSPTTYAKGIRCNNGQWSAANANNATTFTFYKETITIIEGEPYSATLYGTSATTSVGSANINESTASLTANGLNNDGVKFTVTGKAGFTVDLKLEPLDPNLHNLDFGYKSGNTDSPNLVSAAATNFKFNNGQAIVIPIESGASNPTAIFRNAYNENRRDWYNPGSGTKLSNYYLIDSQYEQNGSEINAPSDKVDADRAGTAKIEFSNIKTLTAEGGTLDETEFNKNNAGYRTITLTTSTQTIYIYSADKPEYCIMTDAEDVETKNTHVAYTFYEATLQGQTVVETPKVEVTPIYTKTYKGDNSKKTSIKKDGSLDETHVFYGVTVTSQSDQGTTFGNLKAAEIVTAISTAMASKSGTYGADDPFRTILYVDMSSLNSISGNASTWNGLIQGSADNCLFFMPSNFNTTLTMTGGGMIAGGENGAALTDIVVVDQQPFYSPYNFRTSTHVANYARKVTPVEGYENTTTVTLVLPFSVALDDDGHPRTSSDHVNSNVLFSRLTDGLEKNDYNDKIYDVVLAPEGSGTAVAHTPYIVQQAYGVSDDGTIFDVSVLGATFVATGTQSGNAITFTPLTGTDASFTSYGTFSGDEIWDDAVFYFSKNYFWNTKTFPEGQRYINMRPFRAWYKSSNSTINSLAKFGLILGDETTGINEITTTKQNSNVVYDIQGRVVSNNGISTLPKGLYIMNGKKIFIK